MHVVLLTTVPGTGTNFMRAFFGGVKSVKHTVELTALRKNKHLLQSNDAGLMPEYGNLAVGHMEERNIPLIKVLAQWWKPIVPVRDPLASLISRKQHSPDQNLSDHMNYWSRLIGHVEPFEPHYVPLDLLPTQPQRMKAMIEVVKAAKVHQAFGVEGHVTFWSKRWPQEDHNCQGAYPLKAAYEARDVKMIERAMPAEFDALRAMEFTLRPLLMKIGYKDLMWWQ